MSRFEYSDKLICGLVLVEIREIGTILITQIRKEMNGRCFLSCLNFEEYSAKVLKMEKKGNLGANTMKRGCSSPDSLAFWACENFVNG